MTAEEILDQYEQARPFYKKGGITVSGGEPLMQIGFVTELVEKAKKSGIHTLSLIHISSLSGGISQ